MTATSINDSGSILKDLGIKEEDSELKLFLFKGKCMRPLLQPGDILLARCNIKIKPGDILVYSGNHKKIAHRLLDIEKTSNNAFFIMCGDDFYGPVDFTTLENTIGKVIGFVRNKKMHRIDKGLYSLINLCLAKLCILRYQGYKFWVNIKQSYIKPFLAVFLRSPIIKRLLMVFLDTDYHLQFHSSDGSYRLIVNKKNKEIAKVFLKSVNSEQNGTWQMSALRVWWPYRTLGLTRFIINRAIDLARQDKATRIELLLRKNSFPMIGADELLGEGFSFTKKRDYFIWRKDL